jgi:lipid A 3-O-deacylase
MRIALPPCMIVLSLHFSLGGYRTCFIDVFTDFAFLAALMHSYGFSQSHPVRAVACSLLLFFSFSHAVFADEAEATDVCTSKPGVRALKHYPDVYNVYFENDLFAGTDNNYTNGVKLSWVSANLEDYINDPCLPNWVRQLNHFSEAVQPGAFDSRNMVVSLGQNIYTPTDPTRHDVIKDDRPYAGWLYLGFAYNARTDRQMDTVEIDVGMVGPASLAQQSQNFIHDLRGLDRFQGWSNTGFEVRIGTFLPNDFGTAPIRPASDSNAPLPENAERRMTSSGVHGFISVDTRAVAHDIFLDGNTFTDSHSVDKRYFVGDVAAGIAWQWPGGKITYAQYLRSKEFLTQKSAQSFGSVTLSLEY